MVIKFGFKRKMMLYFYTFSNFTSCHFISHDHVTLRPYSYSDMSLLHCDDRNI